MECHSPEKDPIILIRIIALADLSEVFRKIMTIDGARYRR